MRVLFYLALLSPCLLSAAPPACETKTTGGETFETCTRADATCGPLFGPIDPSSPILEMAKSQYWNGCAFPANFVSSHFSLLPNLPGNYLLDVIIVPRFSDSERMDIVVVVEFYDHEKKTLTEKDVPIVIRDGIAYALMRIVLGQKPMISAPTADVREYGGQQEYKHVYR